MKGGREAIPLCRDWGADRQAVSLSQSLQPDSLQRTARVHERHYTSAEGETQQNGRVTGSGAPEMAGGGGGPVGANSWSPAPPASGPVRLATPCRHRDRRRMTLRGKNAVGTAGFVVRLRLEGRHDTLQV